jgi:hypothetical protein
MGAGRALDVGSGPRPDQVGGDIGDFPELPDRMATYFGGLLGPASDTCLHVDVRRDGAMIENLTTRLDGADCPA